MSIPVLSTWNEPDCTGSAKDGQILKKYVSLTVGFTCYFCFRMVMNRKKTRASLLAVGVFKTLINFWKFDFEITLDKFWWGFTSVKYYNVSTKVMYRRSFDVILLNFLRLKHICNMYSKVQTNCIWRLYCTLMFGLGS